MTLWDLFRALLRFWPVTLAGMLITGTVGVLVLQDPGVYWTRVEVQFLAPTSNVNPNSIVVTSGDVVMTAGAVARRINGPGQLEKYGSADVTLVGLGVREGWSVRLPDVGGQWAPNFARQVLVVEVVSANRDEVLRQLDLVIGRISSELDDLQGELRVAHSDYITTMMSPSVAPIYWSGGHPSRALGMTGALGVCVTVAVVGALERHKPRRSV